MKDIPHLTYYQDEIKKIAIENVLTTLCADGYLIIGSRERLPFETSEISSKGPFPYLFIKKA